MNQSNILVIDDEEPVREAVTDILEMVGLAVETAADGQSGIERYRTREAVIQLILLDLSMPGLNGEQTLERIRQINPRVPVILTSGYSETELTCRVGDDSRLGFLQKPYDVAVLLNMVQRYLEIGDGGD